MGSKTLSGVPDTLRLATTRLMACEPKKRAREKLAATLPAIVSASKFFHCRGGAGANVIATHACRGLYLRSWQKPKNSDKIAGFVNKDVRLSNENVRCRRVIRRATSASVLLRACTSSCTLVRGRRSHFERRRGHQGQIMRETYDFNFVSFHQWQGIYSQKRHAHFWVACIQQKHALAAVSTPTATTSRTVKRSDRPQMFKAKKAGVANMAHLKIGPPCGLQTAR